MKSPSNIIISSSGNGISRIRLNEPNKYNALSSKTLKSLIYIFKSLNEVLDDGVNLKTIEVILNFAKSKI